MEANKKARVLLGVALIFVMLVCIYFLPFAQTVYSGMQVRATTVALRNDYKSVTTPLAVNVVKDICLKLDIMTSSENCQADAPVYAPDFFDEIETYFSDLPHGSRTHDHVEQKLRAYLYYCADPYPDGSYRCLYDLRGDRLYPVYFYFNADGFYYCANWMY
jgi:hypothetical protein